MVSSFAVAWIVAVPLMMQSPGDGKLAPGPLEKPKEKPLVELDDLQRFSTLIKIVQHIQELQVSNGSYKLVYKTDL